MLRRGLFFFAEPQKTPESWAFWTKKKNGNFLSKLPFFCGSGDLIRTDDTPGMNRML